jgi:hypothetical protein
MFKIRYRSIVTLAEWEDLRWKRSETKADEPRGQEVSAGRKKTERR